MTGGLVASIIAFVAFPERGESGLSDLARDRVNGAAVLVNPERG
jgi:hypothetical protein